MKKLAIEFGSRLPQHTEFLKLSQELPRALFATDIVDRAL